MRRPFLCGLWLSPFLMGGSMGAERGTPEAVVSGGVATFAEMVALSETTVPGPVVIAPPQRYEEPDPGVSLWAERVVREDFGVGTTSAVTTTSLPEPGVSPYPLDSFLGLADNNRAIPPDTNGAVGRTHLVVVSNTEIRITDRTGNIVTPVVRLESFWQALSGPVAGVDDVFDPRVVYDPYGGRFIVTAVADRESPESSVLLAVTATEDPTGTWYGYLFDADGADLRWADFPSLGFNKTWIGIHANLFGIEEGTSTTGKAWIIPKAAAYDNTLATGTATTFVGASTSSDIGFTNVPCITYDPNEEDLYFVSNFNSESGFLRVQRITGLVGSEVLLNVFFPQTLNSWAFSDDTPPTSRDGNAPQLGSSQLISTNDSRLYQAIYRTNRIWTAHTVFLPVENPTRNAIQWWELSVASRFPRVVQRGRVEDPTGAQFVGFPTIGVNADRDAMIGFTRFAADQFASANYVFRYAEDPFNTVRSEIVFKPGEDSYFKTFGGDRNRWGDYSSTIVDPLDDRTLWSLQQYAATRTGGSDRWGLWWAQVDPDRPNFVAGLTATANGSDVEIRWESLVAFADLVETSGDLETWDTVAGPLTGTGEERHVEIPRDGDRLFVRIVRSPES